MSRLDFSFKICIRIKIYVHVSRSANLARPSSLINIDQLHGGSTIKYYNDIRVPTSRFAFIHHDPHIYIKIYTLRITS